MTPDTPEQQERCGGSGIYTTDCSCAQGPHRELCPGCPACVCPTCGSNNPRFVHGKHPQRGDVRRYIWFALDDLVTPYGKPDKKRLHWHCPDPFHTAPPTPGGDEVKDYDEASILRTRAEKAEAELDTALARIAELEKELDAARWNAKGMACESCRRAVEFTQARPGLRCAICPFCSTGAVASESHRLRSTLATQTKAIEREARELRKVGDHAFADRLDSILEGDKE